MRCHPVEGARLAAPLMPWLGSWGEAIADHHERWDGSGYPTGSSGQRISLGGRIVAVADAFEAMTTQRAYNSPKTLDAACRELVDDAGRSLTPRWSGPCWPCRWVGWSASPSPLRRWPPSPPCTAFWLASGRRGGRSPGRCATAWRRWSGPPWSRAPCSARPCRHPRRWRRASPRPPPGTVPAADQPGPRGGAGEGRGGPAGDGRPASPRPPASTSTPSPTPSPDTPSAAATPPVAPATVPTAGPPPPRDVADPPPAPLPMTALRPSRPWSPPGLTGRR